MQSCRRGGASALATFSAFRDAVKVEREIVYGSFSIIGVYKTFEVA